MKYFIIAGEPSGDLHGANLMKAILRKDSKARFRFSGGDKMKAVADGLLLHISETSIMGFGEVVRNLKKIKGFFRKTKAAILEFQPDVIIFIDYSGFNLRMAKWVKPQGFKTVYYIAPQIWAWKSWRYKSIKKYIDEVITILPFEKAWYAERGMNVHYVGHPLIDVLEKYPYDKNWQLNAGISKPIIALFPGSRKQEILKMLPTMVKAVEQYAPTHDIVVAATPIFSDTTYQSIAQNASIHLIREKNYDIMSNAEFALVTSGTATLEVALHLTPQIICYKTSNLNYEIGKRFIKLDHIGMPNIISQKTIVTELIQYDFTVEIIQQSIHFILNRKDILLEDYRNLTSILHQNESPSDKAAEIICGMIRTN